VRTDAVAGPTASLVGAVFGLAAHALAFGAAFVAGRMVRPSPGGGFEDLAAVVVTFVVTELVAAVACLVVGVVLVARGRRAPGVGLLVGWLVGLVVTAVFVRLQMT
jgi:hypothetical protein